jgi:tetratricopeptide (TPR) repeat protein
MENYYQLLGLSPTSPTEEIRKLIYKQIRLWSVRINAPQIERRQEAERMLKLLETMEQVLLDDEQKEEYDRQINELPIQTGWAEEEIEEALTEGFRLLREDEPANALFLAIKLTEQLQDRAEAWMLLGQARFAAGEQEAAIAPMKRACELEPENAKYFFALGSMYEELSWLSRAEETYEKAIKLAPSETRYQFALGTLYMRYGNFKHGLHLLEQSVEQEPESDTYKEELVRAYLDRAFSNWKEIEGDHPYLKLGFYPASKTDLTMAQMYVKRAGKLEIKSRELSEQIKQSQELISERKGRLFTGSWIIVLVSIAELILVQLHNPSMLNIALIGLLPLLYFFATCTPRYRVYHWATNGKSTRTDFSYMIEVVRSKLNVFGTFLIFIFAVLPFIYLTNLDYFVGNNQLFRTLNFYFYLVNTLFPVVIAFNFFRNYIRKPT